MSEKSDEALFLEMQRSGDPKVFKILYDHLEKIESDQNIDESLISKNLLGALHLAEGILPPDILETWRLRKTGLDYKQISNKLSVPLGTVKSRFHRLVEILKKEIGKQ